MGSGCGGGCVLSSDVSAPDDDDDVAVPVFGVESELRVLVERLAASGNVPVLIGCRPDGSWFAHHDGCEYDGRPAGAVAGLLRDRLLRLQREQREAEQSVHKIGGQIAALQVEEGDR